VGLGYLDAGVDVGFLLRHHPGLILSVVYLLVRRLLELAILADCPPLAVPGATVAGTG